MTMNAEFERIRAAMVALYAGRDVEFCAINTTQNATLNRGQIEAELLAGRRVGFCGTGPGPAYRDEFTVWVYP
jgi:hypothetical protein